MDAGGAWRFNYLFTVKSYEEEIAHELFEWQLLMQRKPTATNDTLKKVQDRINRIIPEKGHRLITKALKGLVKAVLNGADYTTFPPRGPMSLLETEQRVKEKVNFYTSTATAEGAITGFGGFVSGLADFPLWMSIKMKMLFEMAALYDIDTKDYRERLFILYVFQMAFSSQKRRNGLYTLLSNWESQKDELPENIEDFDWRTFQQDYRDHLDIAKLLQLIPGIGAVVGAIVNHRLTNRLARTAMNAYRMRRLEQSPRLEGVSQ